MAWICCRLFDEQIAYHWRKTWLLKIQFFKWLFLRAFDWEILIFAFYKYSLFPFPTYALDFLQRFISQNIIQNSIRKYYLCMMFYIKLAKCFEWIHLRMNFSKRIYFQSSNLLFGIEHTLFRNKRFMLNEMTQLNAVIFLDEKLPNKLFFVLKVNVNKHRPLATSRSSKT